MINVINPIERLVKRRQELRVELMKNLGDSTSDDSTRQEACRFTNAQNSLSESLKVYGADAKNHNSEPHLAVKIDDLA
jgi:hypothetical protein